MGYKFPVIQDQYQQLQPDSLAPLHVNKDLVQYDPAHTLVGVSLAASMLQRQS